MAVTLTMGRLLFHCRLVADPSTDPPFEVEALLSPLVSWAADEIGSGAPVQTDVHLSIVSQVSNVYLSPAFQYRVTSTGPIGATVWVAFSSRRTA